MFEETGKFIDLKFLIVIVLFSFVATYTQIKSDKDSGANSQPNFVDIAEQSGLNFTHFNGMTGKLYLPEIMGSGAAFLDYDNDGDLDVFIVQQRVLEPNVQLDKTMFPWKNSESPTGKLYRNDLEIEKNGTRTIKFTDVTKTSGIIADGYGFGVASGDINNDGFVDLYICNLGANKLFLNNGNGTFTDISTSSKTEDERWSVSASFFDYDRDGFLDLMVVNYGIFDVEKTKVICYSPTTAKDYCGPKAFQTAGNSLFRNKGDGTFENVTVSGGIDKEFGHALGVVAADFNDDDWTDIYVANDGDPNQLWINLKNGKFENQGFLSGAAVNRQGRAEASMGVDAGDFNQDGTEDVFMTHLMDETHTLFKNTGEAMFDDVTTLSQIALPGKRLTGFGTAFFDYDNDSFLDIFIANGSVKNIGGIKIPENAKFFEELFPLGQPNQLFRNQGNEQFEDVSDKAGEVFGFYEVSRGAAFGDLDNDGDTDILVVNNNGKARLLLNKIGSRNNWLGLKLIGKDGKRDALGSKVEVFINDKKQLRRRSRTDGSYSSAHDPRVLIGLGKSEKIEKVRITWASGKIEEWKNLSINKYNTLREGSATNFKGNQ